MAVMLSREVRSSSEGQQQRRQAAMAGRAVRRQRGSRRTLMTVKMRAMERCEGVNW